MGRVRTLTYPDTEVVTYTYNGFGDVETIAGVNNFGTVSKSAGFGFSSVVSFLIFSLKFI